MQNRTEINFLALSQNQAFARVCAAAFATQLNPSLAELTEIKTAVSEAVTNAIIHGYEGYTDEQWIFMGCEIDGNEIIIEISDKGRGIEDIAAAREPLFTSKPDEERSGMGFTVMEEFMDKVDVHSTPNKGTTIEMRKKITT
ncbi:MAG: anti-sigma F factor [Defluviitaleaceae bacterium]|nr:anti-sigma F factor [Defluviitaleaceae bacterium]